MTEDGDVDKTSWCIVLFKSNVIMFHSQKLHIAFGYCMKNEDSLWIDAVPFLVVVKLLFLWNVWKIFIWRQRSL